MTGVTVSLELLDLQPRYVRDCLKVLIHSILFTRELGIVVPRQVESECGLTYLTIDDINTDKYIEERLCAFEERLAETGQLELVLSFYTRVRKKAFLFFKDFAKVVWEEWIIPVRIHADSPLDSQSDERSLRLTAGELRKRMDKILKHVFENRDHIPPMGPTDSTELIRYPFELRCPSVPWHRALTKALSSS
mmetsp:Transcript_17948/g.32290  ORF Transcript_17948/g.32290 Transcript_17948/m.32290 type:complete len:192 (+) Transcript_17948:165-740(+)